MYSFLEVHSSNRTNLLRNNPSISITPKHMSTPLSRSVQSPSYMLPAPHLPTTSSQTSLSAYPHKLPSSITLTKFDRSPIAHKPGTGISTTPPYGPRYLPQYPRSFDRYPVRNEYSPRMPQSYANNNYSPQYPRPSSSH